MKAHIFKFFFFTLLCFSASSFALPSSKYTKSCKLLAPIEGEYGKSGIPITSPSAFKKITAANQLFADERYNEAVVALKDIVNTSSDKGAIARAHILLAMTYQVQDKESQAKRSFENALKTGALTIQNELSLRLNLANIAAGDEKYDEALSWMKKYFKDVIKPQPSAYTMLANIYYRKNDFKNSICPAYIALKEGAKQKKALYSFLFASHYKLNDLSGSESIAREMIDLFPSVKNNYSNLRAVFSKRNDQKSLVALAELAYLKGIWVSKTDYEQLAALHANQGAPLLAANRYQEAIDKGIIEKSEKSWKTVAYYWRFSKTYDKAIFAYKQASSYVANGKYDFKIANVYFSEDNYSEAIKYFTSAISKGGLKDTDIGNSYIKKGTSQFRLGRFDAAIKTFTQAKKIASVKSQAGEWTRYAQQVKDLKKVTSK